MFKMKSTIWNQEKVVLVVCLTVGLISKVCDGIQLEAVLVPQYKFRGQNATLLCKYELDPNEELFSLKWYKEETEFYRFTPPDNANLMHHQDQGQWNSREQEQIHGKVQTWKVPGIKIDEEASSPQRVILKKVGFKSTGMYRCEVTAVVKQKLGFGYQGIQEFVMKESINRMTVVELPESLPKITGDDLQGDSRVTHDQKTKKVYKPGDRLNLTCTSAPSNPPATLEWIINGQNVDPEEVVRQHHIQRDRGLISSSIGLLMTLEEKHFKDGELRVRCRGTIAAEFWRKDVENVFNDKDSFVKVLEVRESQWPDAGDRLSVSECLISVALMLLFTNHRHFLL